MVKKQIEGGLACSVLNLLWTHSAAPCDRVRTGPGKPGKS